MKATEIRALGDAELVRRLEEAREELLRLRLRLATRQLDNYRAIPRAKRDIARMKTLMRERELGREQEAKQRSLP